MAARGLGLELGQTQAMAPALPLTHPTQTAGPLAEAQEPERSRDCFELKAE